MSWLITAVAVGGALTIDTQLKSGKAQQYELDKQAEEEKIAAKGRELERREKLNQVLGRSMISQATSGIGIEGTPESIALSTAKKASLSEGLESLSDRLRQASLKRQGQNAVRASRASAASTLLKTTIQAGQLE